MDEIGGSTEGRGMSRRTLLSAAAWATPVIVLATALPAAAASAPPRDPLEVLGGTLSWNGSAGPTWVYTKAVVSGMSMPAGTQYSAGDIRISVSAPSGSQITRVATYPGNDDKNSWMQVPATLPAGATTVSFLNQLPVLAQTVVPFTAFEVSLTGPGTPSVLAAPSGIALPLS
ncbi:hypothetical protein N3K63_01860 [Microbacterium sp. W1N]|uniref:hypothetical protein n=1 Tax=Microbacterium festucae TaxID=2977531 RepID=UPI0021BE035E|nr:hypothetical protein [Microbacterium festucae]MCT9819026.1 hypothetical protein [Microbacterium festucae]